MTRQLVYHFYWGQWPSQLLVLLGSKEQDLGKEGSGTKSWLFGTSVLNSVLVWGTWILTDFAGMKGWIISTFVLNISWTSLVKKVTKLCQGRYLGRKPPSKIRKVGSLIRCGRLVCWSLVSKENTRRSTIFICTGWGVRLLTWAI